MYVHVGHRSYCIGWCLGGVDNRVLESEHPSNISKQLLGAVDEGNIMTAGLILGKLVAADDAAHRILTVGHEDPSLYNVRQVIVFQHR